MVENILQIFAPCRAALQKKCYFELHKYLTKYMKPNDHSKIWTTLQYGEGTNCFMSMKSMFAFKDSKHIFFHGNTHIAFLVALFCLWSISHII